jgi:hypothetical protein
MRHSFGRATPWKLLYGISGNKGVLRERVNGCAVTMRRIRQEGKQNRNRKVASREGESPRKCEKRRKRTERTGFR